MEEARPPYGAAALAGLALFVVYALTLAPTTGFWDASEYIATAHTLGIPHPPGNPLFVVLARSWSLLLAAFGLPVAVRINLLAALTSAAASAFFFLVAHGLLEPRLGRRRALVGAGAAAFLGGTAFTVWSQSNVNEKVYTLSVLVIAAVSWIGLRWRATAQRPGSERMLLVALFLMALGSTNHLMSVLPLPALAVLVLWTDARAVVRPGFIGRAVALVVVALSFNFFLPIRAAEDPVINEGDATCESWVGAAQAIYTNGASGCPMLADNLSRRQYLKPPVTVRMAPFGHQVANYLQYFDWQWARGLDPSELPGTARVPVTLIFTVLGLAGFWAAWRADRVVAAYLGVLCLTLTVGLVYYLNFKYGYSLAPEIADPALHEVRERDYFFIASFMLWGVMAGLGAAWTWGALASRGGGRRWIGASPVLLVAVVPLALNWSWATRSGDYAARDWAFDLLVSVEPYGVLFTNGDNDTFPLWYLQEVEGIRRDVTVIVGQYLFTSWYPKQLQELTHPDRQRPFDPELSFGLYDPDPPRPTRPVTQLPHDVMDRIAGSELAEDATISFPEMAVTYPAGTELNRGHQLALSVIHDAIAERPIYFASSAGMMTELGLERWGVRQGLVSKLVMRRLEGPLPDRWVQGSPSYGAEVFDVERSLALYSDVYRYRGIRDRAIWADRSTLNIPWQFYAMALQLGEVAGMWGADPELVERLGEDARTFRTVADGGVRGTPES